MPLIVTWPHSLIALMILSWKLEYEHHENISFIFVSETFITVHTQLMWNAWIYYILEIKEILTFLLIFKVGKRRSVPGVVTFPLGNHITRETQYQNSDMQDPTHCMFIFNIFVESNTEHLIILRHSLHFNLDAAFRWQR